MKKLSNFLYFVLTFSFLTFINFRLSNLIASKILIGWHFSNRFLRIIYAENTGAAFSIMQNHTHILIILSIIALFAVFYYFVRNIEIIYKKEILFLCFLLAGICGNLYERLFLGYVRDFFDLAFIDFPIFNVSDIFINVGVIGIIVLILLSKRQINL